MSAMLASHLATLNHAGLIAAAEELEYMFRHALIQDAAYESLLRSDRRRLHRAVAQALLSDSNGQHGEHAALLGSHFAAAEDYAQALHYFLLAADRALASFANAEAEQLYRRAAELRPAPQQAAWIASERGRALARLTRHREAVELWAQGIAAYRELGDLDGWARLAGYLSRGHWDLGSARDGLDAALTALDELGDAPASHGLAALLHEAGRLSYFCGQPGQSAALCARARRIAEQLDAPGLLSEILTTEAMLPQPAAQALRSLRRAVELGDQAAHLMAILRANNNLGVQLVHTWGEVGAAIPHLERALEMARRRGSLDMELSFSGNLSLALLMHGDIAVVEAMQPRQSAIAQQLSDLTGESSLTITDALLKRYRGQLAEALDDLAFIRAESLDHHYLQGSVVGALLMAHALLEYGAPEQVAALMREVLPLVDQGIGWGTLWPRSMLVIALAELGAIDEARQVMGDAQRKAEQEGLLARNDHLLLAVAHLAAAEGLLDAAIFSFETAAALQHERGKRWEHARTLMHLAATHRRRANPLRASELLHQARDLWAAMGLPFYVAQAEALLG